MNNRQPEPAPPGEAAVKRLEEPFHFLGGDPQSFVTNPDEHSVLVHRRTHAKAPAIGHGAQRVGAEVPDNLLDLAFVGLEPDRLVGHVQFDGVRVVDVGAVAKQQSGILQHAPQSTRAMANRCGRA
jgi:hypothetical protein